ncbi:P-loop guanosine triphosphatase YjiA-like [Salvia divinorum]|uniref:P-loop guanosine triphosphatase YjiA-like n=1 Tax=Salvia divinorum TaxID=28513 RepID=A0ABD1I8H3_SALDI
MASVASVSMEIAFNFVGLAKSRSYPISFVKTTHFFSRNRQCFTGQNRKFLACTSSDKSRIVCSSKQLKRRFLTAASAATSAAETGDSDVVTKIPPDNRIPATIITGFLGSGKTTLLNHILTAEHGKRIAVIENEFGEVDIDGSLVAAKAAGAEDIMMLNNGCLCCTVRGDLVRMISELVSKKKGKFDHIVIETTGLANPAPIIQTFYAEDQLFNDVKLDGVVTLVDAKHAGIHLDEVKPEGVVNEAIEQIAYADRIIVNKTDLVGEPAVASLFERIRGINRMAQLKRTQYGQVDLDYVLGIGGFDLERIDSAVDVDHSKEAHDGHSHEHEHKHEHDHDHHHHGHEHGHNHNHEHHDDHHHDHTHDPGVSSVSIVCEGTLDLEKANMWLGNLLLDRSEDIYRMKGLLSVDGMDERFVFQGVHDIFQGSPDRIWGADEARVNKLVFIGKNLDREELEQGFMACLL